MSVTGIATNPMALIFIVLFQKFQIPIPKSQATFNRQVLKKTALLSALSIIDAKINVNSRASAASPSRVAILLFVRPVSTNRRNSRLSLASLQQIFARIRKSFLLNASSASIQLAATEPDARIQRFDPRDHVVWRRLSFWNLEFRFLLGIWSLGFGICGRYNLLGGIGQIIRRNHRKARTRN